MDFNNIKLSMVLIAALLTGVLQGFAQQKLSKTEVNITGFMKLKTPVEWVYLTHRAEKRWVDDSSKVVNGHFSFKINIPDVTLGNVFVKRKETRMNEVAPLFLQAGKINLTIHGEMDSMKVQGSPAHTAYLSFNEKLKPFGQKRSELNKKWIELGKVKDAEGQKQLEEAFVALMNESNEQVIAPYILKNTGSPIIAYALNNYVGSWPQATPEKLDKTQALFKRIPETVKKRPSVAEFGKRLDAALSTVLGRTAVDFTLADTAGRPVTLSSFKGKYVFIDFWASWCKPCRANNPYIVKAYHDFKGKNIVVMGISLDKTDYKTWMNAIHTDKLPYLNLIDTKYPEPTSVGRLYNIAAIPQNVLIDPNGKIVAKNIEGEEMTKKFTEVVGKPDAESGK